MKKHCSIFVLLFTFVYSAFAIQAIQTPIPLTQSDGTIIMARLYGDEHFSYMTTLDGLLITKTSMGQYDYAVMATTGLVSSIGLKVSPENKSTAQNLLKQSATDFSKIARTIIHDKLAAEEALYPRARRVPALGSMPARFPLKGDVKSIAILVNYTDVAFTIANPQTQFTNLLNEEGYSKNGAIGSSRDYFIANSNGAFKPTFDVYGPVTLPHSQAYYGAKTGSDNDSHAEEMVRDACNAVEGLANFKDYDIDGDGVCDNVFIYYAGHNEAEGGGSDCIWPHRYALYGMNVSVDGVKISDYACTSELRGGPANTTMCGMATFSHEFGHVLGLVDYYDTQNSSNNEVPGSWNIMSSGNYNGGGSTPPSYCAQDRFYLGWLTPIQISDVSQVLLEPLETSNTAYLMAASNSNMNGGSPDPNEYFLLSNRQYVGWDAASTCLPTHGLMISHVDFSSNKWRSNSPNNDPNDKGYDIIRADGTYTNESGDLFPGSNGKYSSYNPVLKDKTDLGLPITQIIETGLNISFAVKGGDGTGLQVSSNAIEFVEPYSSTTGKLINTADKVLTLVITGVELTEDVTIVLDRGRDYSFRLSDDEDYTTSPITLAKSDEDAVNGVLQIKFDPQIDPDCSTDYADVIYVSSGDYKSMVSLTASTQRELLITTPEITAVTDTSFSGFTLNWNAVDDAEGYYVTLQKKIEGGVHTTEDFTDFGTISFDTNWDYNFSKYSNSATSSAPKSAWFSSTGNQLTTPVYTSTITTISFWMKPISSTEGSMTLEGYDGETWTVLKVYDTSVLSARIYTIDLDASKGYIQFRITADIESGYGIAFDDFDAYAADGLQTIMNRNPVTETSYVVTGLESGETYDCFLESYENKGCQLNRSDPSETQTITTISGGTTSNSNLGLMYDASTSQYSVLIKKSTAGYGLNIYDMNGHLAAQIPVGVVAGSQSIALPLLDDDMLYVVVYCSVSDGPSSDDSSIKYVSNYH